ncbi:MAG: sn-glycerol-3-phosphate ABC transporter ATP-binding protein UgpC [Deltaproteobacteria bacterium]|nr:sn-glycerol-3-phosphate ABC transporter ATP-binding protein UgpC [Deltaproteobacteria bacterium]
MASVRFDQVDKQYPNGHYGVRGVSLDVADGELLVLVGPSGCGKSTLLRLLAGLEAVTLGRIFLDDRVVNDLSPQQRNVAMVFQDYALYPFMTVAQNLAFPLEMRRLGRDEIARRIDWAARVLDLAGVLDRLPRQLSGGQRQRVAMGRALVREPSVSLLDEPLSNLDAKLRVEVRAQIAQLQAETRRTMVYVTHDQTEAMTLGHRIAVMDQGHLQQVAPPAELYDRPANRFVAGFIGNPPMNVFPVELSSDAAALHLVVAGQSLSLAAPLRARTLAPRAAAVRHAGIRPEALALAPDDARDDRLSAVVTHVEFLGHETLAHVALDPQHQLVVRLPGMQPLKTGDRIRLHVDPAQLHLFDETGAAL